jgi:tetratricopeptide (TPR) repeat protein
LLASGEYTADALFYLARIADYRGEHDQAIRLYSQVLGGSNAVASQRRAAQLLAWQRDDLEGALDKLDRFAEQRRVFAVEIMLVKAGLLGSMGKHDAALELFDRIVEFRPDDEAVLLSRGELLLTMGRLDDAIAVYREAAQRWPDSAMALNALGYTLADRTDEYREAEKLIRKALKYNPDSPAIIDSLGWVLHKRGRNEEALAYLEEAYAGFPDPEVAAHIVEVLAALDRRDEALERLVAAEERDPENDLLKDVRERVFAESP